MRMFCCALIFISSTFAGDRGMQTRVFPLKIELIGGYTFVRPNQLKPASPIGYREPRTPFEGVDPDDVSGGATAIRQSAKAVLLNEGIPFPPGATASFHPQSGLLSVHNTPENLQHVQLFLDSFDRDLPVNLSYLVTVIEAPGEMIRQVNAAASSNPDCYKELSSLLAAAKQTNTRVSVVGDAFVESRSGSRSTFTSVQEHLVPTGMATKAKNSVTVDMDLVESGLKFEAESWLDEKDLKLILEVNSRPPSLRPQPVSDPAQEQPGSFPAATFWQSRLTTALNCQPGHTRLISVTKPLGAKDNDVLWAVFISVGVQRISSIPAPTTISIENDESAVIPAGLKQIVFNLPEGFLEFFVPETRSAHLKRWLESNGLEKTKGATASHGQGKLIVTNTQENIERVHGILREMSRSLPGTPVFTLSTIQAPATRLRDMTRAHILHSDHAALWNALQEAVSKGEASYVDFARITADSDCRATHHSGQERSQITNFSTNENGLASVDFESREIGSVIGIEGWLPSNDDYVSVSLSHELQTGPPASTRHTFKHPVSGKPFELSLPVLPTAKTAPSLTITPGTIRLVSLCRPTGNAKSDVLWATFISCDVMRQIPSRQSTPITSALKTNEPMKRETRVFQPPTGFFSSVSTGWGPVTDEAARQAFKQSGIAMSSDAEIHVSGDSAIIRVTATRENLDQIDAAFKKTVEHLRQNVVVTAHVFEGSGPFIREVARSVRQQIDHTTLLSSLQTDARIGKVKYVTTMRVGTQSAIRAKAEQTRQMQQLTGIRPSGGGRTEFSMEMHNSGHLFELEPKIHPDDNGITLEFALETSLADPVERHEQLTDTAGRRLDFPLSDYLRSKLTSTITMIPGTTKLAWIYRPPETSDDRLHAVFLNCTVDAGSK